MSKIPANLASLIATMDSNDLNDLVFLVKARRKQLTTAAKRHFRVGQRVRFDAKHRGMVTGIIIKMNPKTIRVLTDTGGLWRVSPTYLKAV